MNLHIYLDKFIIQFSHIYLQVYFHTYVYVFVYVYVCVYIYMYVLLYVFVFVYVYVYMHSYWYMHILCVDSRLPSGGFWMWKSIGMKWNIQPTIWFCSFKEECEYGDLLLGDVGNTQFEVWVVYGNVMVIHGRVLMPSNIWSINPSLSSFCRNKRYWVHGNEDYIKFVQ